MKFLVLALALSFNLLADSFDIKCTGSDLVYINSFSMDAFVDTSFNEMELDIETRTHGYDGEINNFIMTRKFKINRILEINSERVIGTRILSLDKESDITYINIILDYPGKLTSTIRMKSGREFKSTCKQL